MEDLFIRTRLLPRWIDEKYFRGTDFASIDDLIGIIEDLKDDLDMLEEEYEHFKRDVQDNYKLIGTREAIGYDESW